MGRTEFPDLNLDYERALVGRAKAKASTRAKWRALRSARSSTLKKVFDSADIVREGIFQQLYKIDYFSSFELLHDQQP